MKSSITVRLRIFSILVIASGGMAKAQLTAPTSPAAEQPSKIIFVTGNASKRFDIFQISPDGSGLRLITHDHRAYMKWNCCPAWSPDGQKIAFVSSDLPTFSESHDEIFILDVVGDTARALFSDDTSCLRDPAWSPDARHLVFVRGLKARVTIGRFNQHRTETCTQTELVSMNLDGTGLRQISHNENTSSSRPAWSPDGGAIAYVSSRKSDNVAKADIHLMDSDGSNPRSLTQGDGVEVNTDPSWSPDGSEIAFCSNRDGTQEAYLMNRNGTHVRQLTHGVPGGVVHPSWSPDGHQIMFGSRDARAVYIMKADGTDVRVLERFAWHPDFGKVAAP